MKILFIKNLELTNGIRNYKFERMKVYQLPNKYAKELINKGYAVGFGFMSELPTSLNNIFISNEVLPLSLPVQSHLGVSPIKEAGRPSH